MVGEQHAARLDGLARWAVDAVVVATGAAAALIVGSVADGAADEWSDIDLVFFHGVWPGGVAIRAVRDRLDGTDVRILGGDPTAGPAYLEQFHVDGVACQFVHQTVDAWREQAASVLRDHETDTPVQKALSGLQRGRVVRGDALVAMLRAEAAYPPELRRRMVAQNLDVFPLWALQESLARRDAELWQRGELVRGLQKVLAILAGVNESYFSTFQLKHLRNLVVGWDEAPGGLADRIDAALVAPMPEAALALEALVDETLQIVEAAMPDLNVSSLLDRIGRRVTPNIA